MKAASPAPRDTNWKSFQYFNFYRLIVAALLVVMALYAAGWGNLFRGAPVPLIQTVGMLYVLVAGGGTLLSVHWRRHFDLQLSCQMLADIFAGSLLMYGAGGLSSGLGVLLLVSLAAASLVGRGRLVLFYAATATLAVLFMQVYGDWTQHFESASLPQAGFLSAGFFATAILARLLGQRLLDNEELARQRGIALQNEIRISQRVIERMQDGVLVVRRDGAVLRRNPVAETMLALSGSGGGRLDQLVPPLAGALAAWLRGEGPEAVEFSGPGGRRLRARLELAEPSGDEILMFLEDVERIQARAHQLKLAALGRLTASIAHEIRNPLSAIGHAGELLAEERRGETHDRLLRIVRDNVGRLDRIVRDVLDLGRNDRGQPETLRLDAFVRDFADEYVQGEGLPDSLIAVEADAGEQLFLRFDRAHLHRVLSNLVGNAVRHSRRQPGSVRLSVVAPPGSGRVELHVADDGPGVPEAVGDQIFEPFFTTHHEGTGLGLFIARELCEAGGASLELARGAAGGHFVLSGRREACPTPDPKGAPAAS